MLPICTVKIHYTMNGSNYYVYNMAMAVEQLSIICFGMQSLNDALAKFSHIT